MNRKFSAGRGKAAIRCPETVYKYTNLLHELCICVNTSISSFDIFIMSIVFIKIIENLFMIQEDIHEHSQLTGPVTVARVL